MAEHEGRRDLAIIGSGHALSHHMKKSSYPEADVLEKTGGEPALIRREMLKDHRCSGPCCLHVSSQGPRHVSGKP